MNWASLLELPLNKNSSVEWTVTWFSFGDGETLATKLGNINCERFGVLGSSHDFGLGLFPETTKEN